MKNALIVIISVSLLSCSFIRNIQFPKKNDCSIIAISIKTRTPLVLKNKPEVVYFVKIDEKDVDNLGSEIIPSNYVKGDYAYIINARPGKYAAIGSFFTHTDNCYNTLYDSAIINATVTEVGSGQVVFAGQLTIDNKMKSLYKDIEKNGDKAQFYYYNLLKNTMTGFFYRGSFDVAEHTKQLEREFLLKTQEYFKNTEWDELIQKSIEASNNSSD